MIIEGQVGPQVLSDGATQPLRQGKGGEGVVTELHGKYYEATYRGGLWYACPASGVTSVLAVIGTTPGAALYNPVGSGVNLVIVKIALAVVSGTYVAGVIMHGVNNTLQAAAVTGTAMTYTNGLVGKSGSPQGKAFTAATLPANPTPLRPFANKTATPPFSLLAEDIDGQIILQPGAAHSLYVIGADTTPTETVAYVWEEVPI